MNLEDRVVVITGAAGGIGAALARRFAAERVGGLVLADLDGEAVDALATELSDVDVIAAGVDVTVEAQLAEIVGEALQRYQRIDLFCANAGVTSGAGPDVVGERPVTHLWCAGCTARHAGAG